MPESKKKKKKKKKKKDSSDDHQKMFNMRSDNQSPHRIWYINTCTYMYSLLLFVLLMLKLFYYYIHNPFTLLHYSYG